MSDTRTIDYAAATAGSLAGALAAREVSAVELFDEAVRVIEAKDGPINAVVVRDFDRALAAAKAADAALARGERRPLLGVPMTVKESNNIAGLPTTWGLAPFKGWTPAEDSVGVTRLKGAGAVILGKTNVPPSLGDWQAANPIYGRTNNPHDLGRTPGGSSGGGAAALAAGMVPLEFGSDIGGSIRVPAHFCGVYGHKPTFDLVPMAGHIPPAIEGATGGVEFGVVGPLARAASDLDLALSVLAGPADDEAIGYRLSLPSPRGEALRDYRVLVLTEHPVCATDAEIAGPIEALADRLAGLGARVVGRSELMPDLAAAHQTYLSMLGDIMSLGAPGAKASLDAHAWMMGITAIARCRQAWREVFAEFDVVLAPPFGVPAFPHTDAPWPERRLIVNGEETPYGAQLAWPGVATFPGLPSTCAPIAKTAVGLPVGAQIIGPRFEDRTPIAFAGLIEREFG